MEVTFLEDFSQLNDPMIMRQIIVEHYQSPVTKGLHKDDPEYKNIYEKSATCIDNLTVELKIIDDKIIDAGFDGVGCAISTASTDIINTLIINKTIAEAQEIIQNYFLMIEQKSYNEKLISLANVFKNTYKQMSRIKCAKIGVGGLLTLINNYQASKKDN